MTTTLHLCSMISAPHDVRLPSRSIIVSNSVWLAQKPTNNKLPYTCSAQSFKGSVVQSAKHTNWNLILICAILYSFPIITILLIRNRTLDVVYQLGMFSIKTDSTSTIKVSFPVNCDRLKLSAGKLIPSESYLNDQFYPRWIDIKFNNLWKWDG